MNVHALELYVCPQCRGKLHQGANALSCSACEKDYPVTRDIPDFVLLNPQKSTNPFLHGFGKILAPLYESPFWFPIMLKLLGGWDAPTLGQIVKSVSEKIDSIEGLVLDVATGTGTYGRHIAGSSRTVYGIDISLEMLRKGQQFAKRESVEHMNFARADGVALPFDNGIFDGCLFCGSLHVFPDTKGVLEEVGRTLKPGAGVIVTTLIHGDKGILKARGGRHHEMKNMKVFDLLDLKTIIEQAGFVDFKPETYGCLLMFTMKKRIV
jgi:SAM-dependent methyltransferase